MNLTSTPNFAFSRRNMLSTMAVAGVATFLGLSVLEDVPFQPLANCATYTLTPEIYNCKSGKWESGKFWQIRHREGSGEITPLANGYTNVLKTRVLLQDKNGKPVPSVLCKVDKRSLDSDKFPWHPFDSKMSDSKGYATFDPCYVSPGTVWQLRYSAKGAEDVYRTVYVSR